MKKRGLVVALSLFVLASIVNDKKKEKLKKECFQNDEVQVE